MSTPPGQQQDYYQRFQESRDKMIDIGLGRVDAIKTNAIETGKIVD
jgi:hypothetical protein